MNLILWRHAEAQDLAASDLARQLTARGQKQAQAAAKWLRSRIDDDALFLVSPAVRTVQTAEAFGDRYQTVNDLSPGASAQAVIDAAHWPDGPAQTVVIVGHQPTLGRVAALLMTGHEAEWSMKKAGIWWFEGRSRAGDGQVVLRAVTSPDLL
jgi:phosphohistidine phosphatase